MKTLNLIFKEVFYVLSGAFVIFVILELTWPDVVLAYLNINWVLILWFFVGIILLLTDKNK